MINGLSRPNEKRSQVAIYLQLLMAFSGIEIRIVSHAGLHMVPVKLGWPWSEYPSLGLLMALV